RFRRHHDVLRESRIDTLVVAFPEPPVPSSWSAAEQTALRTWVRAGGRLVDIGLWPPVGDERDKDQLVYLQDISAERSAPRAAKGSKLRAAERSALRGPWAALVGSLGAARGEYRLVAVKHARVETLLADRGGALAVRFRYGRGQVISLASPAFFENRALARGGDARLAYLAARPGHDGVVAFDEAVRGDIVEKAWYRALDTPELVALAVAALAGLLWLLYGIIPLGPAVRLRPAREPTSGEFVDAVAVLYERARARDHARDALVADARHSLERAPRTAENTALAARVAAAATEPLANDAALVALAQLARTARENTRIMVMDRAHGTRARRGRARARIGGAA
ncbi:MAG TPA: DUF4350 domain-containing protein, partial [Dongiaceae bacterium]|nr:DUF4350 domain-containing protein [Dongiaceae bacterium]